MAFELPFEGGNVGPNVGPPPPTAGALLFFEHPDASSARVMTANATRMNTDPNRMYSSSDARRGEGCRAGSRRALRPREERVKREPIRACNVHLHVSCPVERGRQYGLSFRFARRIPLHTSAECQDGVPRSRCTTLSEAKPHASGPGSTTDRGPEA